ncbi:MAG TPA: thioredoxin [Polyangiaceae bacterium]|nr:thioredoxin [Polyangiaceae bacterium]
MSGSKNVIAISDSSFDGEVLKSDSPVLVDFTETWCGPCKQLSPIVDKIADENVGKYKVAKVDIDECPSIAQRFRIKGVPTVMVFKGGQVKGQHVGVTNKETLLKLLES